MEFTDSANSKTFEKDIKIYIKMTFTEVGDQENVGVSEYDPAHTEDAYSINSLYRCGGRGFSAEYFTAISTDGKCQQKLSKLTWNWL